MTNIDSLTNSFVRINQNTSILTLYLRLMQDPNYSPDSMDTESDGSGSGDSATMTFMDDDEGDNDDWGHPEQLGIGSGQVVKATLDNDNFAVVDVPDCGVDIRFRPPNTQASQQTQSPGIALSVDASNCKCRRE